MIYREFHEAGYRVFPLLGATDQDGVDLDAKEAFKRPRSSGWQHTPHWSDEQLDLMEETGQFATGYGVLCAGLIVIDIDARNGGVQSWERLQADIPEVSAAGLIVNTGSGGGSKHLYFKAPAGIALMQHLDAYKGIDMKASGFVVGAGSQHASGSTYEIALGSVDDIDEAPQALIDLLRKPERHRAEYNGQSVDVSLSDIAEMLSYIDPDCDHETWVRCGMAAHDATGGLGFSAWDDWSAKGSKYPSHEELTKRWHSFGKSSMPVTIGTLIHHAEQGGWQQPVTFTSSMDEFDVTPASSQSELLDISSVDLLRPPGFTGEVCAWMNDQCRYPREHLAVMAALVAMGNVVGLRYIDDLDGTTANLFGFGVADSGTGKESVYGAHSDVLKAAGIIRAMHGMQKSEQEVIRNLIRNQPAFYNIDEFGIQLQKIINAGRKGTASYLEAIIGIMMSAYSKAGSYLPISGDLKEETRAMLQKEVSQHQRAIEANEDKTGKRKQLMENAQRMLDGIDNGIEKPFLSVMGMTTPGTFDALVTPEQATSGFIGRAIIVRERDPNPPAKYPFTKREMPQWMENRLSQLYHGGYYDASKERIEYYGERVRVQSTSEAVEAMRQVYHEFYAMADQQKEHTGLTALPRRGYEMVSKVSLILAASSDVRTLEHVRWAYALVKRDIEEKLRLVMSNDISYGLDRVLMAKITSLISADHGETFGVIKNRLRGNRPEDIQKALAVMEARQLARKEVTIVKSNGKTVERWFFTG